MFQIIHLWTSELQMSYYLWWNMLVQISLVWVSNISLRGKIILLKINLETYLKFKCLHIKSRILYNSDSKMWKRKYCIEDELFVFCTLLPPQHWISVIMLQDIRVQCKYLISLNIVYFYHKLSLQFWEMEKLLFYVSENGFSTMKKCLYFLKNKLFLNN